MVELVFRDVLDLEALRHWKSFCRQFDIPREAYSNAFGGSPKSLCSRDQGFKDQNDPSFLNKETRLQRAAAQVAVRLNNKLATWNYVEATASFGALDALLVGLGVKHTGIFHRYLDYYCWSRWEKVLFLPSVPRDARTRCESRLLTSNAIKDDDNNGDETRGSCLTKGCRRCKRRTRPQTFLNFDENSDLSLTQRFINDLLGILLFANLSKSLKAALKTRNYQEVPFRIVDGVIEWINYLLQVSFPITLCAFYYLVFKCY